MLHHSPYRHDAPRTTPTAAAAADVAAPTWHGRPGSLDDPTIAATSSARPTCSQSAGEALQHRIQAGMATGTMSDQAAAVGRLFGGVATARTHDARSSTSAGATASAWSDDDGELVVPGDDYLMRQISSIGGGTTEMARNVVSERVLGMPRERSGDKGRAVPRRPSRPVVSTTASGDRPPHDPTDPDPEVTR